MVVLLYICHNLLSCGIYTTLDPSFSGFDIAIPTSFSIFMKMLVSLVFH